jgi:acyl carrier protein
MTQRELIMTVITVGQNQRTRTANGGSVDIEKMRALIAKNLDIDVRRVTDDAHLIRDLGADWLDRLELIILVEEISGVEIADHEADLIEVVGDLIRYIDKRRNVARSAPRGRGSTPAGTQRLPAL